jgi:hypothetical protein
MLWNEIIDRQSLGKLLKVSPGSLKQELLDGHQLKIGHHNVWLLTERDRGTVIQGTPGDVFLFRLKQNSGAGYLWRLTDLAELGFSVIFDTVDVPDLGKCVCGPVERFAAATVPDETAKIVRLTESQPWDPESVSSTLELDFDLFKERGQSQNERRANAAAV